MENYYETDPNDSDNKKVNEKSDKPEIDSKSSFDFKTAAIASVVFIAIVMVSIWLFTYLKNKDNKSVPGGEITINMLPEPEKNTSLRIDSTKIDINNSSQKPVESEKIPEVKKTSSPTETKTIKNDEPVAVVQSVILAITTIAPGNNASVAGNPIYIGFTTNKPSYGYYESIEYIYYDGSKSVNYFSAPNNISYSNSHTLTIPANSNPVKINAKLKVIDSENKSISENYTYNVL